jgi:DNA-binding NarL/FixJ family response regulator
MMLRAVFDSARGDFYDFAGCPMNAHRVTLDLGASKFAGPARGHADPTLTRESAMPQQSRMKVLIAHSDPLIAAGLVTLLRKRRDFEVLICSRALSSNATARHLPPANVIVADYDSGLRLLESAGAGSPRVIILTHSDSEAKISRALEQGVRGYLLLGCSLQELIKALRSVNGGRLALGPLVVNRMADWMKQPALTRREEDTLRQMMLGLSNKAIARKLTLEVGTVKTHVKAILRKLDATSRTEAVAITQRRGILREDCECLTLDVAAVNMGKRWGVTEWRDSLEWFRLNRRSVNPDATQSSTAP